MAADPPGHAPCPRGNDGFCLAGEYVKVAPFRTQEAAMVRSDAPAIARRSGMIAFGLMAGLLSATVAQAQAPAQQAQAVSQQRLFPNDGGMVLIFIKPDKTADFEMVMGKLKEALAKTEKPERKQQAAGWKVFKSPDPAGANTLYVFVIYPALKGADYQVSNIIAEAFPAAEANDILKKYADAFAQGMNIVNLNLIQSLGK